MILRHRFRRCLCDGGYEANGSLQGSPAKGRAEVCLLTRRVCGQERHDSRRALAKATLSSKDEDRPPITSAAAATAVAVMMIETAHAILTSESRSLNGAPPNTEAAVGPADHRGCDRGGNVAARHCPVAMSSRDRRSSKASISIERPIFPPVRQARRCHRRRQRQGLVVL